MQLRFKFFEQEPRKSQALERLSLVLVVVSELYFNFLAHFSEAKLEELSGELKSHDPCVPPILIPNVPGFPGLS